MKMGNSVDEFYEGKSVAIPFTWESQPGTPKVKFREAPLPPLTPPPSYYYKSTTKRSIKHSKSSFLKNIFPKRNSRKATSSGSSSPSSISSFSLSPSSYSAPSSPITPSRLSRRGGKISSPRMSYNCRAGDKEDEYKGTTSTLCIASIGINPWSKIVGSKGFIRV